MSSPVGQATQIPSSTTKLVAGGGALLYLAFACGLFYLASDPHVSETVWNRLLVVFNGIASVGFACFGTLLGTTIQNAKLVEAKAETAKKAQAMTDAMEVLADDSHDVASDQAFVESEVSHKSSILYRNRIRTATRVLRVGLA